MFRLTPLALVAMAGACGSAPEPTRGAPANVRQALRTVSAPALGGVEAGLQERIQARYTSLAAVRNDAGATDAQLADAYGQVGKMLVATELFDQAEPYLLNARMLAPKELAWIYYLAHVNRLRNRPDLAIPFFRQVLDLQPDYVPALVWLGSMELEAGQPAAAAPLFQKALSLEPRSAAARFGLGRMALSGGRHAEAVQHLEAALAADPGADVVHYALSLAYRGLGDAGRADDHLRRWKDERLYPADPLMEEVGELLRTAVAFEVRGTKALDDRKWSEAVSLFRQGLALAPNDPTLHQNLGSALFLSGDVDAAEPEFEAALRLSPGYAKSHFSLAVLQETRGRDREAIDHYTRALALDPALVTARFALADALRRNGRVEESLPHYAQIIASDPAASQARFGQAMAFVRLRRHGDARRALEQAVTVHPDQPGLAHALARLLAAAPDDGVRDGRRALAMVESLESAYGATPGLLETAAMALAEVGRFTDAVARQRQAMAAAARPDATAAARLQENLRLYESRTPCRTPWRDDDPVHFPRAR